MDNHPPVPPAKRRARRTQQELLSSLALKGIAMVPRFDGTVEYECQHCTLLFGDKFKAETHTCCQARTALPICNGHTNLECNCSGHGTPADVCLDVDGGMVRYRSQSMSSSPADEKPYSAD